MAQLAELSWKVQLFLRAYRWRRIDPVPWTPLRRPLAASRLGLVSSAGLVAPGQVPFDREVRGGDWSWREIDGEADVATLVECHRSASFDHSGIARDRNLAFPLDRLRELVARGRLGSLAARHASFMGSLTAVGRFVERTAPAIADSFVEQQVDVALLVPV